MELLTRNNFEGWMQKILDRLDRQDELLLAIKTQGQQPPSLSEGIRLCHHFPEGLFLDRYYFHIQNDFEFAAKVTARAETPIVFV